MFDAVPVLEVLVNECWEGQELTRAGIKVEIVFFCVEAGLFRPPPTDEVTTSERNAFWLARECFLAQSALANYPVSSKQLVRVHRRFGPCQASVPSMLASYLRRCFLVGLSTWSSDLSSAFKAFA